MGVSASLSPRALQAEAGGETRCQIRVRNTGTVVDQFVVDVVGATGPWATVEPESLNLLPGDEGVATVVFKPPRSHNTPAGDNAFGVRVFSKEDPSGSTVEEGVITIAPFSDLTTEIVPRTARGRRRARFEVAVDNRGNLPVNADLLPTDPDQLLNFDVRPPALACQPGTATFAKVSVRPKQRFMRGPAKTLPFQVTAAPQGEPPVTADGAMVQEALIPKWLPAALAALIAAAIVLAILWATLFKPAIQDAAKTEANKQLAAANKKADQAATAAQAAGAAAKSAQQAAVKATGTTSAAETTTTLPNLTNLIASGQGQSFRIQTSVPKATAQTVPFTGVPAGKTFMLTDLVLENPQGDTGMILVHRGTGSASVLFQVGLGNFRDLDYHFVSPLLFKPGQQLSVEVQCTQPGGTPPPANCNPAVTFSGVFTTLP